MQDISSVPPDGALPMHEALRQFVPDELWKAFEAAKAVRSKLPRRPTFFSTSVREWEAERANYTANQARSAQADMVRAWKAINRSLIDQLIAGDLTAFAQSDPPFGRWREIPVSSWQSLWIKDAKRGHVAGSGVNLVNVYVMKTDQKHLYAMMTGAPGRPQKSMSLIKNEFERRCAAARIEASRTAQANVLLEWLRTAHPDMPEPTVKTIYNKLPAGFFVAAERK